MADFGALLEPLARRFFGEPNRARSTKTELRFGAHGSKSVDRVKQVWKDHETGEGGGTLDLVRLKVPTPDPVGWLVNEGMIEKPDKPNGEDRLGKIVATYQYQDEAGAALFEVVKFEPKDYRQRVRDLTQRGGYRWSTRGVRQVPYRLPELRQAIADRQMIWVVEGEKDVERMRAEGCNATCNPGGAGKWRADLSHYLDAAVDVVVIADNDPQAKDADDNLLFHPDGRPRFPGQDHAQAVAASLQPHVRRLRVLDLGKAWPQCPSKGDVSNYLDANHSLADLFKLIEPLPQWAPETTATIEPLAGKPADDKAKPLAISDKALAKAIGGRLTKQACFPDEEWSDYDEERRDQSAR